MIQHNNINYEMEANILITVIIRVSDKGLDHMAQSVYKQAQNSSIACPKLQPDTLVVWR